MVNTKIQEKRLQGILGWLVETANSTCFIAKQGAQVLSFKIGNDPDLLWLSSNTGFDPMLKTPIRGGIPICWPWFAKEGQLETASQHGLVRTTDWDLIDSLPNSNGGVELRLKPKNLLLNNLDLQLEISIGQSLNLNLITKNIGQQVETLTQAFHTYFAVQDARQCRITNLEGTIYRDKLRGYAEIQQTSPFEDQPPYDRIYLNTPNIHELVDPIKHRSIEVKSKGSRSTVVWNPGEQFAAQIPDIQDGWTNFVCVETANSQTDLRTLTPGELHSLAVTISSGQS